MNLWRPAVRKQILDLAVLLGWQPGENVLYVGIRVMPIDLGALNQAHHGGGTLACPQRSRKEPIAPSQCDRTDLVLAPIVVNWHLTVIQLVRQCHPAFYAVVQCFCGGRAVGSLASLQYQPLMQGIGNRFGPFLSNPLAVLGTECLCVPLHVIQ